MLQDVLETEASTAGTQAVFADSLSFAAELGPDKADLDPRNSDDSAYADQLLRALATMAARSKRRQADLCAALQRSGLDRDPERVTQALRRLEKDACIEHLVPLYDGGVLMSVTSRGIEKLSRGPRWSMLDGAGFLRAQ